MSKFGGIIFGMDKFILNSGWRYSCASKTKSLYKAPEGAKKVDFPFDFLLSCARDFNTVLGYQNSYFASSVACFYNVLPTINNPHKVMLSLAGVLGGCDVFINGKLVGKSDSTVNSFLDITKAYAAGASICLRIATHPDSGKYIGLGIAGEVAIFSASNHIYINPKTVELLTNYASEKGEVKAVVEVTNNREQSQGDSLVLEVYNCAGKKVIKKTRAIKLAAGATKKFEVTLKAGSIKNWAATKALYFAHVGLASSGLASFGFGASSNKKTALPPLVSCYMANNSGLVGAAAREDFLMRKYKALLSLGFNRVVFSDYPQERELQVLAGLGLYASVKLDTSEQMGYTALTDCQLQNKKLLGDNLLNRYPNTLASDDILDINQLPVGMDYLGTKEPHFDDAIKPIYTETGALDILANPKAGSKISAITAVKGKGRAMGICQILVQDPHSIDPENLKDNTTDTHAIWNWPLHVGKKVKVIVHASGDIIALNLNGKSVGRKLAGRPFGYKAIFVTEFFEGTLEAISFARGKKDAVSTLSSVGGARSIVATALKKNVAVGEWAYIDVAIADNDGSVIEFATKTVEVKVCENGEFVSSINGSHKSSIVSSDGFVTTHDGRALVAVRALREGKTQIEITGEGLRKAKVNVFAK